MYTMIRTLTLVVVFTLFTTVVLTAQVESERPNILFIILDDAGTDMGAYGSSFVKTPAFDRIAEDGLLFEKAYTPNAKCAPSRATILTGRNSWQLDAAVNHLAYFPTKFKTFPEVLEAKGYLVGNTGKAWAPGIAETEDNRPRRLVGTGYNQRTLNPPTPFISKNDYSGNFGDFLKEASKTDKPWMFWVGSLEPHRAYTFGSGAALGKKDIKDIKQVPGYWPDTETVRNDMLDYAFEIEYMDGHVQKMLDQLHEQGLAENTVIIYTSDHGMPFPRVKGDQYEASNHVPLAISWGDKIAAKGRRITDFVSFIDLAPTILELAGIPGTASQMQPITGLSLLPYFQDPRCP